MSDAPQKRQLPFWLAISLMVNLALLGLAVGMLMKRGGHHPHKSIMIKSEHHVTSHRDRRQVGQVMREAFIKAEPELSARRVARKMLGDAVNKQPFNAADVSAAVAQLRDADHAVHKVLDSALVSHLDSMTPEQRAIVARSMARDPSDRSRMKVRHRGDRGRNWKTGNGPPDGMPPPPPEGFPPLHD